MQSNHSIEGGAVRRRGPQRHKNPRRFHCEVCQKHFGRLEHLQRHERTHTQERPFACISCSSRFTRSDLLIRHGRLSHSKGTGAAKTVQANGPVGADCVGPRGPAETSANAPSVHFQPHQVPASEPSVSITMTAPRDQSPSDILFIWPQHAAHEALQNPLPSSGGNNGTAAEAWPYEATRLESSMAPRPVAADPGLVPGTSQPDPDYYTFDGFDCFLEAEPLPSFHFSSLVTTEQPMPFFSPQTDSETGSYMDPGEQARDERLHDEAMEEPGSFSRLGSRLPSLQPEEPAPNHQNFNSHPQGQGAWGHPLNPRSISDVSGEDKRCLQGAIAMFATVSPDFKLPTRLSLSRYIRAYVDGFHEHLPFLHIPSMRVTGCSVELILSMAAVGAQYCFEAEQGLRLFHAARAIATERIRRRDIRIAAAQQDQLRQVLDSPNVRNRVQQNASVSSYTANGPLGLPSDRVALATTCSASEDLMQSAQALLILMAMATWAKHKEILREALAIQSILASIVRDDGLRLDPEHEPTATWEDWARYETVLRTKYIVFCFFNLHCIVYDIPPLILNSELHMRLPCSTAQFKAHTEAQWQDAIQRAKRPLQFQDSVRRLFSFSGREVTQGHSALGNYVLIHAIVQHIFFVRKSARYRFDSSELTADEVAPLDQAIRNWQCGWKHSPESSVNPLDPNGPVAFNSTALLRLAYIRLNMDTGPGRALGTRDPLQIAHALRNTSPLKRTPKLMRALLHSAHALSIPIKIGIRLVAKMQTFTWSIQHSLCSLECALLLGKWLEAISALGPDPSPPLTAGEGRILCLVRTILDETEFRLPFEENEFVELPDLAKRLNAGALRVWAAIFKGSQTWDIVEVIGNSLDIYADILGAS